MSLPIRVKLIARGQPSYPWKRQTPGESGRWGDCQFLFDLDERDYDWLVVIDDVSRRLKAPPEILACADDHTILVTTEPPTITHYGKAFAAQFGHVLTSQSKNDIPHPGHFHTTTGNLWFHGKSFDELTSDPPPEKNYLISTVCSSKQQKHTVHQARYDFTQWLKSKCPDLEIYGHGVRFVEKKHEALDPYRYHLAVENHVAEHHWTEKFSDPLLSYCVPIYHGCPNIGDYFSEDCYLKIDITKPEEALDLIITEINDPDSYKRRYDALLEARRLVLERYNLLALLSQLIAENHKSGLASSGRAIFGRKQMRMKNPGDLCSQLLWKTRNFLQTVTSR